MSILGHNDCLLHRGVSNLDSRRHHRDSRLGHCDCLLKRFHHVSQAHTHVVATAAHNS